MGIKLCWSAGLIVTLAVHSSSIPESAGVNSHVRLYRASKADSCLFLLRVLICFLERKAVISAFDCLVLQPFRVTHLIKKENPPRVLFCSEHAVKL